MTVDEWWTKTGRASFVERAERAKADSKVKLILSSGENMAERLKGRVDADIIPYLCSYLCA